MLGDGRVTFLRIYTNKRNFIKYERESIFMKLKTKVLIAESNENFRISMSEMLKNEGNFEIVGSTGDCLRAMELIKIERPDVVLTSLLLSGADGLMLLEKTGEIPKERRPKIIIISGFATNQVIMTAKNLGATYFIQKPCEPMFILSRIRMLIDSNIDAENTGEHIDIITQIDSERPEYAVTEIIQEFSIPANIKGYQYLREAIIIAKENMDVINAVTKELYPGVAKKFHTTPSRVERAIRHAIKVAWERSNEDVLQQYFGYKFYDIKNRPTNSEFIATIADKMNIEKRAYSLQAM